MRMVVRVCQSGCGLPLRGHTKFVFGMPVGGGKHTHTHNGCHGIGSPGDGSSESDKPCRVPPGMFLQSQGGSSLPSLCVCVCVWLLGPLLSAPTVMHVKYERLCVSSPEIHCSIHSSCRVRACVCASLGRAVGWRTLRRTSKAGSMLSTASSWRPSLNPTGLRRAPTGK